MDIFKKTALPSIEDFAKDIAVKKHLNSELGRTIRIIQEEYVDKTTITDDEPSNNLCSILEAIFIHGLKDKLSRKMSSVFGNNSEKIPEPQFWSFVSCHCHKNVINEIKHSKEITTDIGRGRSWLRLALNDGLINSYVGNMLSDTSTLQKHYSSTAFMRDDEQADIMKQLLEGLHVFTFQLFCNSSTLNIWNMLPLTLSNLWTPPANPQPVMPAVDVIDFFTDPKNQGQNSPKTESTPTKKPSITESFTQVSTPDNTSQSPTINSNINANDAKERNKYTRNECLSDISPIGQTMEIPPEVVPAPFGAEETSSKVSSSDSVPDFGLEIIDDFCDGTGSTGNRLGQNSGWSSTFDSDGNSANFEPDQSYDSLLQSYNKNLSKIVIGTPELTDTFSSIMKKSDDDLSDFSEDAKSPDLDFEIVPKYLSAEHADAETKKLMSMIGTICLEKGLDEQNFECNACGRPIGIIYGKARLCHYDGYNYCYECHDNEEEFIPARIVHNWDFKQYPVSKRAKMFLAQVMKDPLLDIKILNPVIYTAVEEMAQMQLLRTQLTFLRSYIFTCKQSIAEDLRMRLWPREYLFEHVHLYAFDDLLEIPSNVLSQTLQKVIAFAKKHIMGCQLCLLKGFICEVCRNSKPIYPFDIETTYHCEKCWAVYHATCMDANKYCPKCLRKSKRQQQIDSALSD